MDSTTINALKLSDSLFEATLIHNNSNNHTKIIHNQTTIYHKGADTYYDVDPTSRLKYNLTTNSHKINF